MRILIADDEALVADSLGRLLRLLGHEVAVASGSDSALEQIKRFQPDLLLLDWLMPEGGGERVLEVVRSGQTPPVAVVLMTGSIEEGSAARAGLPVLAKPFRLEQLQALLTKVESEASQP